MNRCQGLVNKGYHGERRLDICTANLVEIDGYELTISHMIMDLLPFALVFFLYHRRDLCVVVVVITM